MVTDVLPDAASLLALSDERDLWERRLLAAERDAYARGRADGRAEACVALAEMDAVDRAAAHWAEWAGRLRQLTQAAGDPGGALRPALAAIGAGQEAMRAARARKAARPWALSPMEACALRRIRLEDDIASGVKGGVASGPPPRYTVAIQSMEVGIVDSKGAPYGDSDAERVRELIETGRSVRGGGRPIMEAIIEALSEPEPEGDPS